MCHGASDLPGIAPLITPFQQKFLFGLLLSLLALAGCSVGDFLGAYFNTYYNAQKAFSEAETELLAQQDPKAIDKGYLAPFTVPSTAKTKFTAVIEKCSKLLQFHPESQFIDDALLMIGKSYYYQNDHQQAERKLRELIDQFPESDLVLEARLFLANTLYRSNMKDGARSTASELVALAGEKNEPEFVSRASMLLATIDFDNKNYSAAREHYAHAAENAETPEDRFGAQIRVAEMYVLENEYLSAAQAFVKAEESSTTYITDFRSRIGLARMLSKLGRHEESLDGLEELLDNANTREFHGEVDLERANVYRDMGDLPQAVDHYRYVDTTYARTEVSAKSYYELGLLYEKTFLQYDSARTSYAQGRGQSAQSPVTLLLNERYENMNKYFMFASEIRKLDSLKYLILNPPDTTAMNDTVDVGPDSLRVSADTTTVSDTLLHYDKELVDLSVPGEDSDSVTSAPGDSVARVRWIPITIPLDTVEARLALNKTELAALFYTDMEVPDSATHWYMKLLTDHPESRFVPRALYALAQIFDLDSTRAQSTVDSLYREIVVRFPSSEFAEPARRALGLPEQTKEVDEVALLYSQGEKLMESGENKKAISIFSSIVRGHADSPLASKAQYAIGWIYENALPQPDSAISNYQHLVTLFPSSQYALLVRPKLDAVDAAKRALEQPPDSLGQKAKAPSEKERPPATSEPQEGEGEKVPETLNQEPPPVEEIPTPEDAPPQEEIPPPVEIPPTEEIPPPGQRH